MMIMTRNHFPNQDGGNGPSEWKESPSWELVQYKCVTLYMSGPTQRLLFVSKFFHIKLELRKEKFSMRNFWTAKLGAGLKVWRWRGCEGGTRGGCHRAHLIVPSNLLTFSQSELRLKLPTQPAPPEHDRKSEIVQESRNKPSYQPAIIY